MVGSNIRICFNQTEAFARECSLFVECAVACVGTTKRMAESNLLFSDRWESFMTMTRYFLSIAKCERKQISHLIECELIKSLDWTGNDLVSEWTSIFYMTMQLRKIASILQWNEVSPPYYFHLKLSTETYWNKVLPISLLYM